MPEIIAGATTAITGKVAVDTINGSNQLVTPPEAFTTSANSKFPTNHLQLEKVAAGSTDLSQAAIKYRVDNNVSKYKNVTVSEYKDAAGKLRLQIMESGEYGQHSERRIGEWMQKNGIKPEQVTRAYSEFEPCQIRNAFCKQYLAENTPEAKVSYSFEYGEDRASRI